MKFKRNELNKLSEKGAKDFLKSEIGKQNYKDFVNHMTDLLAAKIAVK